MDPVTRHEGMISQELAFELERIRSTVNDEGYRKRETDNITQMAEAELQNYSAKVEEEKLKILEARREKLCLHNQIRTEYVQLVTEEKKLRRKYLDRIMWFCGTYIIASFILLLLNGSYVDAWGFRFGFEVPSSVLIALVGSTSVNVIGLLAIAIKFVFTSHHHKILES